MSRYFDFLIHIGERRDGGGEADRYYPVEAHLEDGAVFDGGRLELDRVGLNLSALRQDAEAHGRQLSEAIFSPEIDRAFHVALGRVQHPDSGYDGLRVRVSIAAEAPELHALAWERIYHRAEREWGPLATSANSPFSRHVDTKSPRPLPAVAGPVRILVVIAHPSGIPPEVLAPIDVAAEIANLQGALAEIPAEHTPQVTFMPGRSGLADDQRQALEQAGHAIVTGPASLDNIVARLRSGYHVIHFLGHGHFDHASSTATLHLEDQNGGWAAVTDTMITQAVRSVSRRPRLIFLAACQSATRSERDAFVGLAPKLVRAQVPAVVAMQDRVSMDHARTLTRHFYASLFEHGLVDLALNQARSHLYQPDRLDWGIPVLFTRLTDGRLFARSEKTPWRRRAMILLACGLVIAALLVPLARFLSRGAPIEARLADRETDAGPSQASTWRSEADALFQRGEDDRALSTYRQARALFVEEKDRQGQASSWLGEARALFRLGRHDEALHACHQARALFVEAGDEQGQGHTWMTEAQVSFHRGQYDEALRIYRQARALFVEARDQQGQGKTGLGEAHVLFRLRQHDEALKTYRQTRALFVAARDAQGQGNTWMGEAEVLFHLGQHDGALNAYRRARTLFVEADDRQAQASAWYGEARVLTRLGHDDEALNAYGQARTLFLEVGDRRGAGNTWIGEAQIMTRLLSGKDLAAYQQARRLFEEAGDKQGQGNAWMGEADAYGSIESERLAAYEKARALFEEAGDEQGQGNTWMGEARILLDLRQYQQALAAYRQARAPFEEAGDEQGQGNAWIGEAGMLFRLGRYEDALNGYHQARALFAEVEDRQGQGKSWQGEAEVLSRLWRNDAALYAYRRARSLFVEVADERGQGNSWRGEADVLSRLQQNDAALNAYRQAQNFLDASRDHTDQNDWEEDQYKLWWGEAEVLLRLGQNELAQLHYARIQRVDWKPRAYTGQGEARFLQGEINDALGPVEEAVRFAREDGSIANELFARSVEVRILRAGKQERRAMQRVEEALALFRRWRQEGVADLDRLAMYQWSGLYDFLIPFLARQGGPAVEKALVLAEEAHAPVHLDLRAMGSRRTEHTSSPSVREERERLRQELAALDLELRGTIAPGEREELQYEREVVDARLELNELAILGSMTSTFVTGTPIDAGARAALVEEAGSILLYYVADDETVAFLLQPGRRTPLVRRIGLSRSQLQDQVRALREASSNPSGETPARDRQRALYDQLVAPFAPALARTPRLTIVPHGPLHELPFEALLVDDRTPLFERWHVSIAPSLSALHALRRRRAEPKPTSSELAFLGIAGGTGSSLPAPAVEEIGAGFDAAGHQVVSGPGSRRAYLEHAPRARHLLVATHGTHVARGRSGHLELTAPDGDAMSLAAIEITQTPLRAELVTLAVSETARGEAMLSDERLDLTRAFLMAGADAVLATRWNVPADESMRRFLLDFYQALRQGGPDGTGLPRDEALTAARRSARERGDGARLWAAWALIGDGR